MSAPAEHDSGPVVYRVALVTTDEGVAVSCPALPGCWSQGRTEAEALVNIREAIELYLDVVGEGVPDVRAEAEAR